MTIDSLVQLLAKLGFTALEAEIYIILLQESPMTGYRVAQKIGKAVANTYKAIESLHSKGAILVDEGDNRLCRAVPARELLGNIEKSFQETKALAIEALSELQKLDGDDRIYQIKSYKQVFERCRQMLQNCEEIAIIDAFPLPLEELRPEIEATAARGVEVAIKVYQPMKINGAHTFLAYTAEEVLSRWPGQWLNMVVDSSEYLLSFLTPDGKDLYQSVWSSSAYLACVYHSGLGTEVLYAALSKMIADNTPRKDLQATLTRYKKLFYPQARGYQALIQRFGKPQDFSK